MITDLEHMSDLKRRVADLELAVLALGADDAEELGDNPGHAFRGNQHTGGGGRSQADILARAKARTPAQDAKAAYVRSVAESEADARKQYVSEGEPQPHYAKAMALLDEIDRRSGPTVSDATNMSRAEKLLNYEKMHGTEAMLAKLTPAEREAHASGDFLGHRGAVVYHKDTGAPMDHYGNDLGPEYDKPNG